MPTDTPRLSSTMLEVTESEIAQVWKLGFEVPDVVGLWVGEGDMPTPQFISDAASKALREGHTFYTHKSGIPELRTALQRYHRRLYGVEPAIERITVTGSAMTGILMLMQAVLDPGDSVVVVTPVWPNIFAAIQIQRGVVREVALRAEGDRWRLDLDALFAACLETGTAVETNGLPDRIDLSAEHVREAVAAGVLVTCSTDAHSVRGLQNMRLAVGTARRGWCTAANVLNTRPLAELL